MNQTESTPTTSPETNWPEVPSCHEGDYFAQRFGGTTWREPINNNANYLTDARTCSYCGCIHPEDFLKALDNGARLDMADWKYGWPHKFYVEGIPNPIAGQEVETGSYYNNGSRTPIMGPAPATLTLKWYNEHLADRGISPENFERIAFHIFRQTNIKFMLEDGRLKWARIPFPT